MSASNIARKIEETRASIAALKRQAEGVAKKIEIQQIKLQAYLELDEGSRRPPRAKSKPKKPDKPALFTSTRPWDRIFAAVHEAVRGGEFGAADIDAQLALMKKSAPPTTIRSRLRKMARRGALIRIGEGRYRFPAASEKEAA